MNGFGTPRPLRELATLLHGVASTPKLPVLFTAHGYPLDILNDTVLFRELRRQGEAIRRAYPVHAVLIVSAHWNTRGSLVNVSPFPKTIHDFTGFPEELYRMHYRAPGAPKLAQAVAQLAPQVQPTTEWGFDHGSWPILQNLFPAADVPIVQLSMDYYQPAQYHFDLARQLKGLREKGVLVIGSGAMAHNLQLASQRYRTGNMTPFGWEIEFDQWAMTKLLNGDFQALVRYQDAPHGQLAAPTPDHYVPLLYALGVSDPEESITLFHEGFMAGCSDRSFRIG